MYIRRHRRFRMDGLDLDPARRFHRHLAWGGTLIAIGCAFMLDRLGLLDANAFWLLAPAVLVWSGLVRLAFDRSAYSVVRVTLRFAIAAYLVVVIEHVDGWTFAATWPVVLIGVGIANVAHALWWRSRRDDAREEPTW